MNANRLIPYLRQSRRKERTISIEEQRRDVERWASANGVKLADPIIEQGKSGAKDWRARGVGVAIAAVERGEAAGIIVAWQDRLSRENGAATAQVWEALDAAGARLVVANEGLDTATGDHELTFTIKAAIAREQWKRYRANWDAAKRNAVDRGVAPYPNAPTGYRKGEDGVLELDPATSGAVEEAFRVRAVGASIREVRDVLKSRGVVLSWHGVSWMLESRCYLGELTFGDLHNPAAHPPLVSPDLFAAVERRKQPARGARPRSDRLLARLGIVKCATCGGGMVVGGQNVVGGKRYHDYRCVPTSDCPARPAISADKLEKMVVHVVRLALRGIEGRAAADDELRAATAKRKRAEIALANAVENLAGIAGARDKLAKLQDALDTATATENELTRAHRTVTFSAALNWDEASPTARRELVEAVIERVEVAPGRGDDRVSVHVREVAEDSVRSTLDAEAQRFAIILREAKEEVAADVVNLSLRERARIA